MPPAVDNWHTIGIIVVAGVCSRLGTIAYYKSLHIGLDTSIVTTISALYFVVPAVLTVVVLSDSLTATDIVGIGAAVVAIVLLT